MEKQQDYLLTLKQRLNTKLKILETHRLNNRFADCLNLEGQIFAIEQMIMDYNDWMSD